jgi:hypothetical protein
LLVFEDFERAGKYFATAYSFAEAKDVYDSYQIDNHYARFLLMRAMRSGDVGGCMAAFRDARKLLSEEIQNERLHYPFRVAKLIGEFYDTFASALPPADKGEIGRAAKFISERIGKLPLERQRHRSVTECADAMEHVLGLVDPALLEKAPKK